MPICVRNGILYTIIYFKLFGGRPLPHEHAKNRVVQHNGCVYGRLKFVGVFEGEGNFFVRGGPGVSPRKFLKAICDLVRFGIATHSVSFEV